jgi:hypothetical protein
MKNPARNVAIISAEISAEASIDMIDNILPTLNNSATDLHHAR